MEVTVAAAQGGRKYMEDRVNVQFVTDERSGFDYLFSAIYDGHGGFQASDYASRYLHQNVTSNKAFDLRDDEGVLTAIREGFIQTHYAMHSIADEWPRTPSGYPCTAGTTASCLVFCPERRKLFVGHVGDSTIMAFGKGLTSGETQRLTEDHKPDSEEERSRIQKAGGDVGVKAGISRVVWRRVRMQPVKGSPAKRLPVTESVPFLAIARALGDFWSLNEEKNEYTVSPEPDVQTVELADDVRFIVLASDGLTNVMSPGVLAELLKKLAKEEAAARQSPVSQQLNYAHRVMARTFLRWRNLRADNVSLICVRAHCFLRASIKLVADILKSKSTGMGGVGGMALDVSSDRRKIEQALTENPTAIISIHDSTVRVRNGAPVRVTYRGPLDRQPPSATPPYLGPGFVATLHGEDRRPEQSSDDEDSCSDSETENGVGVPTLSQEERNRRAKRESTVPEPPTRKIKLNVSKRFFEEQGENDGGEQGVTSSGEYINTRSSAARLRSCEGKLRGVKRPLINSTDTWSEQAQDAKRARTGFWGWAAQLIRSWVPWPSLE